MTDRPPIAPLDLEAERRSLGDQLEVALKRVLQSGRFVLGPEVEALERSFAELCGVPHAFGVSSGTEALVVALRAAGIGPGDHVLTSPFTFFASAGAIAWVGATPIFADIEADTGLLDPKSAAEALTPETRAILPVHIYGQLADIRAFRIMADEHGLVVIEDGAQAHGATRDGLSCGELGDAGTFSFYPTKNLGAAGEAGLIVTKRDDIAEEVRLVRDHGMTGKYVHGRLGTNARMDAFQAAILNVKLPHLEGWNKKRCASAARYDEHFQGAEHVKPLRRVPNATHVYHQYAVRISAGAERDAILKGLAESGIHAAVHYPTPVHLQPAAQEWGYKAGDFPESEALANEVLCLPIHPFLSGSDVDRVAETVLKLVRG